MSQYWKPLTAYNDGDIVEYQGYQYKIIYPHIAQPCWAPADFPRLYSRQDHNLQQGNPDDKQQNVMLSRTKTQQLIDPPPDKRSTTSEQEHKEEMLIQGHAGTTHDARVSLDWTACVEFDKFELGTSFSVLFFLGKVPEDPKDWLWSDTCVGTHDVFAAAVNTKCVVKGFVRLDHAISLGSLEPSVVMPYLSQALQWRVQEADGTPAKLNLLEVTILCTPLTYLPGSIFPIAGETRCYKL